MYICLLSLGNTMSVPDVGSLGNGVTRGPDVFVFRVQPVVLHLDPCSSPADHPEPDPVPAVQPGVLWRPRAHNSGRAAAAAHHWGHIIWRQPQDPSPLPFRVSELMCPKCPLWVNEVCVL